MGRSALFSRTIGRNRMQKIYKARNGSNQCHGDPGDQQVKGSGLKTSIFLNQGYKVKGKRSNKKGYWKCDQDRMEWMCFDMCPASHYGGFNTPWRDKSHSNNTAKCFGRKKALYEPRNAEIKIIPCGTLTLIKTP